MSLIKNNHDKKFQFFLIIGMIVVMLITVYPVWYSVINSFNSAESIGRNGYALVLPKQFSLDSWSIVLNDPEIIRAFLITLTRTVLVTVFQSIITSMFAYGFSRRNLRGRRVYFGLGLISMYLNGGVIAYFILFNAIGLYNSFWVYVIPALFGGFYNVIIYNANFKAIPESLFESAKMDGANEYTIFSRIVFPLSKPVISALGIFTAVAMWNDYTSTLYYTRSTELQTLSYYTLSLTKSSEVAANLSEMGNSAAVSAAGVISQSAADFKTIELASMVLSALPLILMYPFAQKFFEKGVMVGSVKG
ncbi:carbohydrate ABC transporter permease [Enterococcus casseliflavus]|uniref:carbohydrate ABC transporter permease n=1 Tax=Enterococcus casseliflavus TaxID=37734 RepID=UPI002FBD9480